MKSNMYLEDKIDFTKFTIRIYICRPIDEVFNFLSRKDSIVKWFVKNAEFIDDSSKLKNVVENMRAADKYNWEWMDGSILKGRIIEVTVRKTIKFTFGKDVVISLNLEKKNEKTLVELTEEQNISDSLLRYENYIATLQGWSFYLVNLKSICEGGIDLREKNPDIEMLVNV